MADETKKLSFRVPAEVATEIDRFAGMMGQNRSEFLKMVVRFGMATVKRQMEPEAMLTDELISKMALAYGVEPQAIHEAVKEGMG